MSLWFRRVAAFRVPLVSQQLILSNTRPSQSIFKSKVLNVQQSASCITVSRVGKPRNRRNKNDLHWNIDDKRVTNKYDVKHISFDFYDELERVRTTWTFTYPRSTENVVETLRSFSHRLNSSHYEHADALRDSLTSPSVEKILFEHQAIKQDGSCDKYEERLKFWTVLVREKGKLTWSEEEMESLISLRKQGLPLKRMEKILGKSREKIKLALRKLGDLPFQAGHGAALPRKQQEATEKDGLAGGGDRIFQYHLWVIWEALLRSHMTAKWKKTLRTRTDDEWQRRISHCIPTEVNTVLAKLQCPTFEELRKLPQCDTKSAGVYAWLMDSRFDIQIPIDRHVYVGSASKYREGLCGRIDEVLQGRYGRTLGRKVPPSRLQRDVKQKELRWPGTFVALMTMKMPSAEAEDILDVRTTVVLARAILTVWLGALQSPPSALKDAFPWKFGTRDYVGWSSHNPLERNIAQPRSGPNLSEQEDADC